MKPWTAEPGSRLAQLRMRCHDEFDVIWEFGPTTRSEAYAALAREMGLTPAECHFSMFDEALCERALKAIQRVRECVS